MLPDGGIEPVQRSDVADRAEHARDGVERLAQVERRHVALVQLDAGQPRPGDGQLLLGEVDALDPVLAREVDQVRPVPHATSSSVAASGLCARMRADTAAASAA